MALASIVSNLDKGRNRRFRRPQCKRILSPAAKYMNLQTPMAVEISRRAIVKNGLPFLRNCECERLLRMQLCLFVCARACFTYVRIQSNQSERLKNTISSQN